MIELYCVSYYESNDTDSHTKEYFQMNQKRNATTIARRTSKLSGHDSFIWNCKGFYVDDVFNEVEATHVATYRNGKKQK